MHQPKRQLIVARPPRARARRKALTHTTSHHIRASRRFHTSRLFPRTRAIVRMDSIFLSFPKFPIDRLLPVAVRRRSMPSRRSPIVVDRRPRPRPCVRPEMSTLSLSFARARAHTHRIDLRQPHAVSRVDARARERASFGLQHHRARRLGRRRSIEDEDDDEGGVTDRPTSRLTDQQTDRPTSRRTSTPTDPMSRSSLGLVDGHRDRPTDRPTDRDRPTDPPATRIFPRPLVVDVDRRSPIDSITFDRSIRRDRSITFDRSNVIDRSTRSIDRRTAIDVDERRSTRSSSPKRQNERCVRCVRANARERTRRMMTATTTTRRRTVLARRASCGDR